MFSRKISACVFLCLSSALWGASPETSATESLPVFRVQAAEVRVTFTATGDHNRLVTDISSDDFRIVRDGVAVEPVTSLSSLKDSPLSIILLCDVSDSTRKALPLEELARRYVAGTIVRSQDQLRLMDFGATIKEPGVKSTPHLTSLYDSAFEVVEHRIAGNGRHAVILISDGGDNYSLHNLGDLVRISQQSDVAFYTVNVGRRNTFAEEALQILADKTGGQSFYAKNSSQMLKAVQAIDGELRSSYVATFHAATHNAGLHQLALQPVQRKLKFFYRASYYQPGDSDKRRSDLSPSTLAMR